jgi:hypothetical protein
VSLCLCGGSLKKERLIERINTNKAGELDKIHPIRTFTFGHLPFSLYPSDNKGLGKGSLQLLLADSTGSVLFDLAQTR